MILRRRRWAPMAVAGGVVLCLSVGACVVAARQVSQKPAHEPVAAVTTAQRPQVAPAGVPVRLQIPAIGIDAKIDGMGLTPAGDMEAPTGAHDTGWYKLGPRPGDVGSAVVAGHYGRWQNGDHSVFDDLHALKAGDKIRVLDQQGVTVSFTVRTTRIFKHADDARSVFTSDDAMAHLNLITCQGTWSAAEKTYAERLVVFADRDKP